MKNSKFRGKVLKYRKAAWQFINNHGHDKSQEFKKKIKDTWIAPSVNILIANSQPNWDICHKNKPKHYSISLWDSCANFSPVRACSYVFTADHQICCLVTLGDSGWPWISRDLGTVWWSARKPSKMAAPIQRVGRQALATFMAMDNSAFPSNFEKLKALVSAIVVVNV